MNHTLNRRQLLAALGSAALAGAAPRAFAQDAAWPVKPVSYIVPFTPGGSTDVIGRTLCQKLQDALGQPFVVDNK
ncbi:MAG TPA: tripartite tricarboxylate transporter substrate binding protein, partial [Ramlibacter sp.]|nr:tripartite tricarboxylate transporter substrate binding protein [Ramlibacter sp.]